MLVPAIAYMWRSQLIIVIYHYISMTTALIGVLAFIPESPYRLLEIGDFKALKKAIDKMMKWNGCLEDKQTIYKIIDA